jgi:hypothetical protein
MTLNVLSLGAGVQSSCLLLMAFEGDLPLDAAVFADTQWEPRAVYDHLAYLEGLVGQKIPVHRVTAGDLRADALDPSHRFASMPLYTKDMRNGKVGQLRRQCTKEYKVTPVRKKLRELGATRKNPANLIMGISLDEAIRMSDSKIQYAVHEYPLIDRGMTRADCLKWMRDHSYPEPPKSACIGCPYKRLSQWRDLERGPVDEWENAVAFDRAIRSNAGQISATHQAFLHRHFVPLEASDNRSEQDRGQTEMFGEDCAGVCWV